jgi:hypothetical protein
MLNLADQTKLEHAVVKVLMFMEQERVQQLKVKHSDLYRLSNLGNARMSAISSSVDNILVNTGIVTRFGTYLIADHGLVDGEYIMCFVKQQKLVNTLTIDPITHEFGRTQ